MNAKKRLQICCVALKEKLDSTLSFFEESNINATEDDRIDVNNLIEIINLYQDRGKFEFVLGCRDSKFSKIEWKAKYQSFKSGDE